MTNEQATRVRILMIDINADLGEGFGRWELGDDEALLGLVTSANLACGFHAGDPLTMRRTCERAAARGVAIGAQVGYRDLAGFGRRFIDMPPDELAADALYQIGALEAFARDAGARVSHVKPHGALYNAVVHHVEQAAALAGAVRAHRPGLPVLGLPGSAWLRHAAEAGLTPVAEAFADRAYTPDGTLVPRRQPGAVLDDPARAAERAVRLARTGEIVAIDGSVVRSDARSICVHGDTPGAADLTRRVRKALEEAGVVIGSIATAP